MESNKKQLNEIASKLRWSIMSHFGLEYEVTMTPCTINMLANFSIANSIIVMPYPPSIFFHFKHDFCHDEFDKIIKNCLDGFGNVFIKYEWDPYDYKGFMITIRTDNANVKYCNTRQDLSKDEYENFCNGLLIDFLQYLLERVPEYYDRINHSKEEE